MISGTLAIVYILLPIAAWVANGRLWRRRFSTLPLYGLTSLVGFLFLLITVQITDLELRNALDRYDTNRDGEFDMSEQTPAMEEAMKAWAGDTGRSLVPATGGPTTLILYGFEFAVMAIIRAGRRAAASNRESAQ